MTNECGLICSIFKDGRIGECSNGGISSKYNEVLVIVEGENIGPFEQDDKRPTVKVVKRGLFGGEYVSTQPIKGFGYMMGGCFVYSCDLRFRELVNEYPVPLHDRQEPQKEYDMLSR